MLEDRVDWIAGKDAGLAERLSMEPAFVQQVEDQYSTAEWEATRPILTQVMGLIQLSGLPLEQQVRMMTAVLMARDFADQKDRALALLAEPERLMAEYEKGGGVHVEIEHFAVRVLAYSFGESLGDAPNFVTLDVTHPEKGKLSVTIQRPHGKSTSEVLGELREENAALRERIAALEEVSDVHRRASPAA